MKTYEFEVYEHRHKTVCVQADSREEAEEKIEKMLDEIDFDDAVPIWDDREWEYVQTSDRMKKYIFHYNGDQADTVDNVGPGEMTYHEHLLEEDGRVCVAGDETEYGTDGKLVVEAYFEDGNELTVYLDELEEIV